MNEQIADIMDDAQTNPEKYTEIVGDINAVKYYSELAIIQNNVKLCKIENKFLFFH